MNNKEKTIWKNLFDAGKKLAELNPWKQLDYSDLFVIAPKDCEVPVYFSATNIGSDDGKDLKSLSIYHTSRGIMGFEKLANTQNIAPNQAIRYMERLNIFVGNKSQFTDDEVAFYKMFLGDNFLNNEDIISFRSYEYKYFPSALSIEEAQKTLQYLNLYIDMLSDFQRQKPKIDFKTQMLWRELHQNIWKSEVKPKGIYYNAYPNISLTDDTIIKTLNNKQDTNMVPEIDIAYVRACFFDKEFKKPFVGRHIISADHNKKSLFYNEKILPDAEDGKLLVNFLIQFIEKFGKPKKIILRDEYILSMLGSTCKSLNIVPEVTPNLPVIDNIITEMENFMAKKDNK